MDNFKKVFHVHNESMALRFYNVLAKGVHYSRIYFTTYLTRLHPLFTNDLVDQMHFAFSLLDGNLDD